MPSGYINLPQYGSTFWQDAVPTASSLPASNNVLGQARTAQDTGVIYVWNGSSWITGGGTGGVSSVNSLTGDVVFIAGQGITLTSSGQNITIDSIPTATGNTFAGFDNNGDLESVPGFTIDGASGGMNEDLTQSFNDTNGTVNFKNSNFNPSAPSPDSNWTINYAQAQIDTNSDGFELGTNGNAVNVNSVQIYHHGKSNTGGLALLTQSFDVGNGTDAISVGGISYAYGFGQINAKVALTGALQGYGFQPEMDATSTLSQYTDAFYDFATLPVSVPGYGGFTTGPTILAISDTQNYTGFTANPTITTFTGSAGFTGVGIYPTLGTINSGTFNGVDIDPTVTSNKNYAVGVNVDMSKVTNFAGISAFLVVQDITYTFIEPGSDMNSYQIRYTNTVTAGNEVASLSGSLITVAIQSGASTATQVRAAVEANVTLVTNLTPVITGTAGNAQVTVAATNFTGGVNAGRSLAASFTGDVQINGALSFTGALSVGELNSFAPYALTSNQGVASVTQIITSPTVGDNATISGTDLLGVNTAMLLTVGTNSTITTSFLGLSALGLPAVVSMGTGSTIDLVAGATFAVSLDQGATGGTIAALDLCRSIALPNGITAITKLRGFAFDLPFGDPATTTWGVYVSPGTAHNYMASDLKVGGADTPTNASVAIEIESTTKVFLNARMTTTQKNSLTAVNGMQVYDTTLDKLQVYAAGAWVSLH